MKSRNDAGVSIPDSGRPSLETPFQDPMVAHNRLVSGLSVVLGACSGSRPEYASGPAKWTLAAHLPPLLMRTMQPSGLARATSLGVVRLIPWRGATHACLTGGTASPWSARAAPKR